MRDFKIKQADLVSTTPTTPTVADQPYNHGYSDEEVRRITDLHNELKARDLKSNPISLEEYKKIVVPFLRINRVEAFNLKAASAKKPKEPKAAKAPKEPKVAKPKKLSKKAIEVELSRIVMAKAMGTSVSETDLAFFNEHTKSNLL